jgi:hypothetical protein
MQIVDALAGLPEDASTHVLEEIAGSDEAPDVRTNAALAASAAGRRDAVVAELTADVNAGREAIAMPALVAVADEFGLPGDAGRIPKWPLALGLARRRWAARSADVWRQTLRAGLGAGFAWGLFGLTTPVFVALGEPEAYGEITENLLSTSAWMLGSGLVALVVGVLLGVSSGFAVGVADALWRGSQRKRVRLIFGAIAGLAQSAYLVVFALSGAAAPRASPSIYIPVAVVYGMVQGLIVTWIIPDASVRVSSRRQVGRAALAGAAGAVVALPYVFTVYPGGPPALLVSRALNAYLLPFGIGMSFGVKRSGTS